MFAKCLIAVALCAMIIGSEQQVVVPAYSAAYVPSAYYTAPVAAYSPYFAAAYPSVWAWGSNKNKDNGDAAPRAFSRPSLVNNEQKSA